MENIKYRYNIMEINSLLDFIRIKGGVNNSCKDVYFVALRGVNQAFGQDIVYVDNKQ